MTPARLTFKQWAKPRAVWMVAGWGLWEILTRVLL